MEPHLNVTVTQLIGLLRNIAAMDYRILYDADAWFECAPSEPIFQVQTPADAIHVVSSVACESVAEF
jgi:hypothetical protein